MMMESNFEVVGRLTIPKVLSTCGKLFVMGFYGFNVQCIAFCMRSIIAFDIYFFFFFYFFV